jgi:hypothetical protein
MADSNAFVDSSRRIAEQFLQSVVVVDDQAFLGQGDRMPVTKLTTPGRDANVTGDSTELPATVSRITFDPHELNAKELIDRFAEKGLVCAVIRPEIESEDLGSKTVAVSKRADIVVLDWKINEIYGEKTLGLIKQIIEDDHVYSGRIRLIAIYTAEPGLSEIASKIEQELKKNYEVAREGDFVLRQGAARIVLFRKESSSSSVSEKKRVISVAKLPSALINEFARATMGLLPNFVLSGFSAIRSNTHRVLSKFHCDLDAPYLAHRVLVNPPEEAESHVLPLFVSEIESMLKDTDVTERVSVEEIEQWLDWYTKSVPLYRRMKMGSKSEARMALLELIKEGIYKEKSSLSHHSWGKLLRPLKEEKDKACLSTLTSILTLDGKSGAAHDKELALLMSVRSRYTSPPPILTLGTIVVQNFEGDKKVYYVCVQPACDSLRLSGKRDFPFLKMTLTSDSGVDDFDFIVEDREQFVSLRLNLRLHEIEKFPFKPKRPQKEIRAIRKNGDWIFTSKQGEDEGKEFRWVAELKPDHAQRIANNFANHVCRVGLVESEWLRRQAKKATLG